MTTAKFNLRKIVLRGEFAPSSRTELAMSGIRPKLVVVTVPLEKPVLIREIILATFGMLSLLAVETPAQ